ncbi:UNVERIFIED_CONTAM: hypothetical protein Slati_1674500 [Sesamum latifolium]|uniref:Uncharacterized protein n=1 Tax=Sesamum latifolium TaxID=2727402 RepID=A0AAW2X061_9LAMI
MRAPRRAIRTVLPLPDRVFPSPLLLTHSDDSDAIGAQPNPTGDDEAPPPRVLGTHSNFMQIRVPPLGPPIAESSQAVIVGGGPRSTEQLGVADGFGSRPSATAATSDSVPMVPKAPSPPIYVGNVPLTVNSHSFDKIAVAFHNLSRKTLSFVPPTMQNGEIIVRPSLDAIRDGSRRWSSTAVGYFLGRRPYFHHARSVWPMVREVTVTSNGFVFSSLRQQLLWRRLSRVDRGCFMVSLLSCKNENRAWCLGSYNILSESACKVDVEYEGLPPKCNACMSLGHPTKACPTTKPKPPPVSVYVQKPPPVPREQVRREPLTRDVSKAKETSDGADSGSVGREDMAVWNVRGLNRRDHQVSVIDLVSEHRLQFIGLLETRVQRGLLPRWNWFVDYVGPGNRIWLAWDDDFIGVDVLDTGDQFVHCSVHIRSLHVHVFITIVYGVNDVIGRRALWADLHHLSLTVTTVPWLVGGDFNTVVDISEVCGQSGDISVAAEEFQGCLRDTGLISLPMQGEWFTWHNCSRDSRSLWKRLDRFLVIALVLRGDTPG